MNTDSQSGIKIMLWQQIDKIKLSGSHDYLHIERVLDFASILNKIYGGDFDVIIASCILHDLGRIASKLHGLASIKESMVQAEKILAETNFPKDKTGMVLQSIAEHDQPRIRPSTLEGRILKDADFLAGFGAWGIIRSAIWTGESGGGIPDLFSRLTAKMLDRIKSLEFPESKILAQREAYFVSTFLARLDHLPTLPQAQNRGSYIIIEGISGSGKDTQAKLLKRQLEKSSYEVEIIQEPSPFYNEVVHTLTEKHIRIQEDPRELMFYLIADRYAQLRDKGIPSIANGQTVITIRSFISTLIYQCFNGEDIANNLLVHSFVPIPKAILLLDIDPDIAFTRIQKREMKKEVPHFGVNENLESLTKHRQSYRDICTEFFNSTTLIINGNNTIEVVAQEIWKNLQPLLH